MNVKERNIKTKVRGEKNEKNNNRKGEYLLLYFKFKLSISCTMFINLFH